MTRIIAIGILAVCQFPICLPTALAGPDSPARPLTALDCPAIPADGFKATGLLSERMLLNFRRMESERYAAVEKTGCLREPDYAWPGDMEGRALLAFVSLERATGRVFSNLSALRSKWAGRLNKEGYFGKRLDPQAIDEQQLSGHGWVLRGLCELYQSKHDPGVFNEIRRIVNGLALPTRGAHASYPIDPSQRLAEKGGVIGEEIQSLGRWVLSSDIGCELIFMDGLMQAAILLNDREADSLCEEILGRALEIDLLRIHAQTHASLTGVRGMLRWAEYKRRPSLIAEAEKRFRLYVREAVTENYENWNWFGRPKHTEPCAVVDSFMAAHDLWRLTGNSDYLSWYHQIVYNGFYAEQRANGGFGCSTVAGANGIRHLEIDLPEAWFCCSMRAAEGFAELARRAICIRGGEVFVTALDAGAIDLPCASGRLQGEISSGYPFDGRWELKVTGAPSDSISFHLFTPPWVSRPVLKLNSKAVPAVAERGFMSASLTLHPGERVAYEFEQIVHREPTVNVNSARSLLTYNYGPLILALRSNARAIESLPSAERWKWDKGSRQATVQGLDEVLTPLSGSLTSVDDDPKQFHRLFLFNAEAAP